MCPGKVGTGRKAIIQAQDQDVEVRMPMPNAFVCTTAGSRRVRPFCSPATRLRRFSESPAMRLLALLVALTLPLYGFANAAASIQTPAHYHLNASPQLVSGQDPASQAAPFEPMHDDDVLVQLDDGVVTGHGRQHPGVGHHAHAFDQAEVVYLDGDSDPSEVGGAGKHVPGGGEAPLPTWSIPLLHANFAHTFPEPGAGYCSHRAKPPLRPPSRVLLVPA